MAGPRRRNANTDSTDQVEQQEVETVETPEVAPQETKEETQTDKSWPPTSVETKPDDRAPVGTTAVSFPEPEGKIFGDGEKVKLNYSEKGGKYWLDQNYYRKSYDWNSVRPMYTLIASKNVPLNAGQIQKLER